MKISIIVPVYNTANYLENCFDSLLNQDLPPEEFEIIIVNDGSSDGSLEICERYAEAHPNVQLLSQENAGLSAARNNGVALAHGDYLWFVDSDDFVAPNCLAKMVALCEENQLDILAISAANHFGETTNIFRQFAENQQDTIINGRDFMRTREFQHPIPLHIYNSIFWQKHKFAFTPGIFHEDNELLPQILFRAERLLRWHDICYFIRCRQGSITRSINPKKSFDLIKVARNLAIFSQKNVKNSDIDIFYNLIGNAINGSLHNALHIDRKSRRELLAAWRKNSDLFNYMRRSTRRLYRFEGRLFQTAPRTAFCLYRTINLLKEFLKK